MADNTGIQWADATWNPVRGCSRISPGCVNCYAERQAIRQRNSGYAGLVVNKGHGPRWTGAVRSAPEKVMRQPLHWRRARRIFVNSMSDLFHERLPDHVIDRVFAVMLVSSDHERSPGHTFQVLTKRAERMRAYLTDPATLGRVANQAGCMMTDGDGWHDAIASRGGLTHPGIWLGVSVEDQQRADERIPHLLATPAEVRFLSCEPLLGPVDLDPPRCDYCRDGGEVVDGDPPWCVRCDSEATFGHWLDACADAEQPGINWVIVGGESGPKARSFCVDWARSIVRQCAESNTPCFVKQLGADPWEHAEPTGQPHTFMFDDNKGGDMSEWPEDLRVRQFPEVRHG